MSSEPEEKESQCYECGEYPNECQCWKKSLDYREYVAEGLEDDDL